MARKKRRGARGSKRPASRKKRATSGRRRGLTLAKALLPASSLRARVETGLGAIEAGDRALIAGPERPRVGDSLNLDEAMREERPDEHRWDYLLSVPAASRLVGLEPHTSRDAEIRVVIAKKKNAVAYLRDHLPPKHRVSEWVWVTHGRVGFASTGKARRRLDQNGIRFTRVLRSLG